MDSNAPKKRTILAESLRNLGDACWQALKTCSWNIDTVIHTTDSFYADIFHRSCDECFRALRRLRNLMDEVRLAATPEVVEAEELIKIRRFFSQLEDALLAVCGSSWESTSPDEFEKTVLSERRKLQQQYSATSPRLVNKGDNMVQFAQDEHVPYFHEFTLVDLPEFEDLAGRFDRVLTRLTDGRFFFGGRCVHLRDAEREELKALWERGAAPRKENLEDSQRTLQTEIRKALESAGADRNIAGDRSEARLILWKGQLYPNPYDINHPARDPRTT